MPFHCSRVAVRERDGQTLPGTEEAMQQHAFLTQPALCPLLQKYKTDRFYTNCPNRFILYDSSNPSDMHRSNVSKEVN